MPLIPELNAANLESVRHRSSELKSGFGREGSPPLTVTKCTFDNVKMKTDGIKCLPLKSGTFLRFVVETGIG